MGAQLHTDEAGQLAQRRRGVGEHVLEPDEHDLSAKLATLDTG